MKKALKGQLNRIESALVLGRDRVTGLYTYQVFGATVYLRSRSDYISAKLCAWLCNDVYFREYLPTDGDLVVDIGAGFGHEALFLRSRGRSVRYIGVEVQPSVYECLANTFGPYRPEYTAFQLAIASGDVVRLHSAADYESVHTSGQGPVEVPTISWADFLRRFNLTRIDLLKINIEGAERHLLEHIGDLSNVRRVIVSAHDFRADRGEGDGFRTREFLLDRLKQQGFLVRSLGSGSWWQDWLYAERR